ncbi:hypothetical protein [Deinococcus yunweiensis]|uniref:hypothetical protein n=1 Tax=Deinococcus yunweiensis TaxID=367282 RepID=UPI00398E326A
MTTTDQYLHRATRGLWGQKTLLDWARQRKTRPPMYTVDVRDLHKLTLTPVPVA